MARHNQKGEEAERIACTHLEAHGLRLLKRNFNVRQGEIDLVMREADTTVFVEVRYRSRTDFGGAAESIDVRKQRRIARAAARYLQAHPRLAQGPSRFDVVSIEQAAASKPRIQWIKNAFMAE